MKRNSISLVKNKICTYGHYINKKYDDSIRVTNFQTEEPTLVTDKPTIAPRTIFVDVNRFFLFIDSLKIEIAANTFLTKSGNFEVVEKWEYPYWKNERGVYLPAENNPIGRYLIILKDVVTDKKVPISIHRFTQFKHQEEVFSHGAKTSGCIATDDRAMGYLFQHIQLGDYIEIHNSAAQSMSSYRAAYSADF